MDKKNAESLVEFYSKYFEDNEQEALVELKEEFITYFKEPSLHMIVDKVNDALMRQLFVTRQQLDAQVQMYETGEGIGIFVY